MPAGIITPTSSMDKVIVNLLKITTTRNLVILTLLEDLGVWAVVVVVVAEMTVHKLFDLVSTEKTLVIHQQ